MIRPSFEEAKKLFEGNTMIPLALEIFADIKTSIEILKIIMAKDENCFMLESVHKGANWGRYSFLSFDPKLTIKCNNNKITLNNGISKEFETDDVISYLKEVLSEYKSPQIDYLPPFTGGLVGYFSYDYIKYVEKTLNIDNVNSEDFNDFNLMLFDKVIAFDHLKQKIYIIVNIEIDNFEMNYINGISKLKDIESLILNGVGKGDLKSKLTSEFRELYSKEQYMDMVLKTKEHIKEGDIFQAVISNRIEADFEGSLFQTYRVLRTINPSPYMFYFKYEDEEIAGASPETLITLKNGKLTNFALAGTCKHGDNPEEDEKYIKELLNDEKELSEHNMLVDLARNDLGKISKFGSVKVSEYLKILKLSNICHISSVINSELAKGHDQLDVLGAVLPAGTLSGAPKKRACEIINKLEKHKRGTYGGAIGYIDFTGNMDFCIAIRMAKLKNNKVFVQSGAGIVDGSDPEKEYFECRQKSKPMIEALKASMEV